MLRNHCGIAHFLTCFVIFLKKIWYLIYCELNWIFFWDFDVHRSKFKYLTSFSSVQFNELNNWIERRSFFIQFNKPAFCQCDKRELASKQTYKKLLKATPHSPLSDSWQTWKAWSHFHKKFFPLIPGKTLGHLGGSLKLQPLGQISEDAQSGWLACSIFSMKITGIKLILIFPNKGTNICPVQLEGINCRYKHSRNSGIQSFSHRMTLRRASI